MNKKILLLSVLLLPDFSVAAPFCAVTGGGTNCWYNDVQSCRRAAGSSGACVVNPNVVHPDDGFNQTPQINQRPPIKFIDKNSVTETIQRNRQEADKQRAEEQESELRQLEIEQRRRDLDRQQKVPAPAGEMDDIKKPQPEHNAPLTLVCDLREGGRHEEFTVTVDMVNQTVDGRQARISNNYIEWEAEDKGKKLQWSLNRFSGLMTFSIEGRRGNAQGPCEALSKAERKF